MIKVQISFNGAVIDMPEIPYGKKASFTDFTNSQNGELLIISCESDRGTVSLSKSGISSEVGTIRETVSFDLRLEKEFTDRYSRPYKSKYGPATILLTFEKESIN